MHTLRRAAKAGVEAMIAPLGYTLTLKPTAPQNPHADFTPDEHATVAAVTDRTMISPGNVVMLCRSVEYLVEHRLPGALVECGVWRGGAVMAMLRTLVRLGDTSRDVYLYDTYEGMSEPTAADRSWKGEDAQALFATGADWARASLEDVQSGVLSVGYPLERIHFVKGKVEDTIPGTLPYQIALLRLDTDWYESTKHELTHLYPRLASGGVLIIDDYGWWAGAKLATDEYIAAHALRLLLVRADVTVRYAVKP